jgi:hypothetical protein
VWIAADLPKWERSGFIEASAELVTTNFPEVLADIFPAMSLNTARKYRARVICHDRITNEAKSMILEGLYARNAGGTSLIGQTVTIEEASPALAAATSHFDLVGDSVRIKVSGLAATTLYWRTEMLPG